MGENHMVPVLCGLVAKLILVLNPLRNSSKKLAQSLLPLRPCPFLVESEGIGVTSSILPILSPFLARALIADCAPGPGVLASTPPFPRTLMWMALIPTSFNSLTTSTAASIAIKQSSTRKDTFVKLKLILSLYSLIWMPIESLLTSIWRGFFSISLDLHTS